MGKIANGSVRWGGRDVHAPGFSCSQPAHAIASAVWEKLLAIGPAPISDVLHAQGLHRHAMRHEIQPLERSMKLFGVARTMVSRPLAGEPHAGREYEFLFAAIDGLQPGEVLVTDEADCCVWGELCAEAAMRRGGNGIVIDGFTRDAANLRQLGFPVYCRGRHVSDLLYHREIVGVNEPVVCGGVGVQPGDLIVGSEDGVVVVPSAMIDGVVSEAYDKATAESKVRAALRSGMPAGKAYDTFGTM